MKYQLCLSVALVASLLSACQSTPARDILPMSAEAGAALLTKAEILAMPKVQTAWIVSSPATDSTKVGVAPLPAISINALDAEPAPPVPNPDAWDYSAVREWKVRLSNGKQYTIHQALPRLAVGQEVLVIRYADRLAISV